MRKNFVNLKMLFITIIMIIIIIVLKCRIWSKPYLSPGVWVCIWTFQCPSRISILICLIVTYWRRGNTTQLPAVDPYPAPWPSMGALSNGCQPSWDWHELADGCYHRKQHNSGTELMTCVLVAQLCLTFCNPMGYSPPGLLCPWVLQTRILEWVASPFSGGSSQPRDQTGVSCISGRCFTVWATREALNWWRLTSIPS